MLISLKWLKEYVKIEEDIKTLENTLTMIGQEVEEIKVQGANLDNVVVGKITNYARHPEREKLSLLKVDVGQEEKLQIICGATNHKEGDKVVVAMVGAELGEGFKIKKAKLGGLESCGMLCSEVELGTGIDGDGIIILPEDAKVGKLYKEYAGLDDVIFELEITPNRPDCLSHIGIAREVAAYYDRKVRYPQSDIDGVIEQTSENINVEIKDKARCKRYMGSIVKGVEVKESPEWLKKRLLAMGLNPINNIVDITNFVLFEYNQPLHAFDLDKVEGSEIIIREAIKGEELIGLDDEKYKLNKGELVIADSKKPIALAGIMGGKNTQVDENTKNIFLETAHFEPSNIRETSKNLSVSSDSSYRFERGVDRSNLDIVRVRALSLINLVAGGEVLNGAVDKYIERLEQEPISLDVAKFNKFVGKEISIEEIGDIFKRLGLEIMSIVGNIITVIPPTYREDLKRSADLYEEIIRIYGFENIEEKSPIAAINPGSKDEITSLIDESKSTLAGLGLQEVINYSFIPSNAKEMLLMEKEELIPIKNPISDEMSLMRSNLIYGLLSNIKENFSRSQKGLEIFEVSKVFLKGDDLPQEELRVGIALAGISEKDIWQETSEYDFYDLKGYVESYLDKIGVKNYQIKRSAENYLHPGRSMDIFVGRDKIGSAGQIHPQVVENLGIKKANLFVAEINLSRANKYRKKKVSYKPLIKFPSVTRDLSVIVSRDTFVGDLLKDVAKSSKLVEGVKLMDIYSGEKIDTESKSVTFNFTLRNPQKTLDDQEITLSVEAVLGVIKKKYGGHLRAE